MDFIVTLLKKIFIKLDIQPTSAVDGLVETAFSDVMRLSISKAVNQKLSEADAKRLLENLDQLLEQKKFEEIHSTLDKTISESEFSIFLAEVFYSYIHNFLSGLLEDGKISEDKYQEMIKYLANIFTPEFLATLGTDTPEGILDALTK